MAGLVAAARSNFGCHVVAQNPCMNCCYSRNFLLSSHCLPSPAKACRLAAARCSTDLGQAASVGLPPAPLVDSQSPSSTSGITWAQTAQQGPRSEMEDSVVIRSDGLNGYNYAAVFDGHAGFSSVKFIREELYRECTRALQNGLLLESSDFSVIENAITNAFMQADNRLLSCRLEETGDELESGSTATAMFLGADCVVVAHVGDSRAVISRAGKAEVVSGDHRPYGSSKTALAEIKRIRQAGGWINNGRVCGILSVSRAFGDIKLKTQRQQMLDEGIKGGHWTSKFASRIEMNGDWVTAAPDVFRVNIRDAEFIILASDGLWDSVQSSEAVKIVRNQLFQHGDVQRASEVLANTALAKNGQDNVSIVIADFGKIQQQPNVEEHNVGSEIGQVLLTLGVVGLGVWLSQFASQNGLQ